MLCFQFNDETFTFFDISAVATLPGLSSNIYFSAQADISAGSLEVSRTLCTLFAGRSQDLGVQKKVVYLSITTPHI